MNLINYSIQEFAKNLGNVFNNPIVLFIMIVFLSISTYTDIKSLKIYNKCNLAFLICRIILIFIPIWSYPIKSIHLLGAFGGAIILLIPAMKFMVKMGGDIKLIFVLGLYLGIDLTFLLLALTFALVIIYSIIRKLITKEEVLRIFVPFAPFFTIAFFIMLSMNFIFF